MTHPRHIVLIADDDRLVRESLGDAFDGFGWDVATADCGGAAIRVLEHRRMDLLVSDVDMPDMTGFELLGWVRRQSPPPPPPVVLISARADAALGATALAEGAVTLLPKPVVMAHLSSLVHHIYS